MSEYRKLERDEDKFVNPYHFVELGNLPVEKTDFYKSKGGNTGWIDIDIETLTPIFIPNTSNSNAFNKSIPEKTIKGRTFERKELKSYRFFSYQDLSGDTSNNLPYEEPVIPGSEIRGMIRSAFEAVTNSCLSTIDMKRPLYKRTIRTGTPGLLEYDNKTQKWVIYECIRIGVKMQELEDKEDDNGKKVYSKNDAPVLIDEYNEFKEMEKVFLEIGRAHV